MQKPLRMVIKRYRRKHTLSFEERLSEAADRLRKQAEAMKPGAEREAILRRVSQHEIALDLAIALSQRGPNQP